MFSTGKDDASWQAISEPSSRSFKCVWKPLSQLPPSPIKKHPSAQQIDRAGRLLFTEITHAAPCSSERNAGVSPSLEAVDPSRRMVYFPKRWEITSLEPRHGEGRWSEIPIRDFRRLTYFARRRRTRLCAQLPLFAAVSHACTWSGGYARALSQLGMSGLMVLIGRSGSVCVAISECGPLRYPQYK